MTASDPSALDDSDDATARALVPVGASAQRTSTAKPRTASSAAIEAHILSQSERRRGLKAGPQAAEVASSAYSEAEWSGGSDRRRPIGGAARKKV